MTRIARKRRLAMKGFDRWFVKLSFKTFLKNGAYTAEGFRALIRQTKFPKYKIEKVYDSSKDKANGLASN